MKENKYIKLYYSNNHLRFNCIFKQEQISLLKLLRNSSSSFLDKSDFFIPQVVSLVTAGLILKKKINK